MSSTLKFPKRDSDEGRLLEKQLRQWREQNRYPVAWITPEQFKERIAPTMKIYDNKSFRDRFNSIRMFLQEEFNEPNTGTASRSTSKAPPRRTVKDAPVANSTICTPVKNASNIDSVTSVLQYQLSLHDTTDVNKVIRLMKKGNSRGTTYQYTKNPATHYKKKLIAHVEVPSGCSLKRYWLENDGTVLILEFKLHPLSMNSAEIHRVLVHRKVIPTDGNVIVRINAMDEAIRKQLGNTDLKIIKVPLEAKVFCDEDRIKYYQFVTSKSHDGEAVTLIVLYFEFEVYNEDDKVEADNKISAKDIDFFDSPEGHDNDNEDEEEEEEYDGQDAKMHDRTTSSSTTATSAKYNTRGSSTSRSSAYKSTAKSTTKSSNNVGRYEEEEEEENEFIFGEDDEDMSCDDIDNDIKEVDTEKEELKQDNHRLAVQIENLKKLQEKIIKQGKDKIKHEKEQVQMRDKLLHDMQKALDEKDVDYEKKLKEVVDKKNAIKNALKEATLEYQKISYELESEKQKNHDSAGDNYEKVEKEEEEEEEEAGNKRKRNRIVSTDLFSSAISPTNMTVEQAGVEESNVVA